MKCQQIEDARYIVDAYQIRNMCIETNIDCPTWIRKAIEDGQMFLEADGTYSITNTNCYGIEVGSFLLRITDTCIIAIPEECFLSHYRLCQETQIANSKYTVEDLLYHAADIFIHFPENPPLGDECSNRDFLCLKMKDDISSSINKSFSGWIRLQFDTGGIFVYSLDTIPNDEHYLWPVPIELAYRYIMTKTKYVWLKQEIMSIYGIMKNPRKEQGGNNYE